MTIIEFLLARIAEDETGNGCNGEGEYWTCHLRSQRIEAECQAKRRIVNYWLLLNEQAEQMEEPFHYHATGLMFAVKALASVYADHPNYQPEWSA